MGKGVTAEGTRQKALLRCEKKANKNKVLLYHKMLRYM